MFNITSRPLPHGVTKDMVDKKVNEKWQLEYELGKSRRTAPLTKNKVEKMTYATSMDALTDKKQTELVAFSADPNLNAIFKDFYLTSPLVALISFGVVPYNNSTAIPVVKCVLNSIYRERPDPYEMMQDIFGGQDVTYEFFLDKTSLPVPARQTTPLPYALIPVGERDFWPVIREHSDPYQRLYSIPNNVFFYPLTKLTWKSPTGEGSLV